MHQNQLFSHHKSAEAKTQPWQQLWNNYCFLQPFFTSSTTATLWWASSATPPAHWLPLKPCKTFSPTFTTLRWLPARAISGQQWPAIFTSPTASSSTEPSLSSGSSSIRPPRRWSSSPRRTFSTFSSRRVPSTCWHCRRCWWPPTTSTCSTLPPTGGWTPF